MGAFSLGNLAGISTPVTWDASQSNPTLSGIPSPIAPVRPSQNGAVNDPSNTGLIGTPAQSNGSGSIFDGLPSLPSLPALGSIVSGATSAVAKSVASNLNVEKYVIIGVGLLMVAAGVFSFTGHTQTIIESAKGAAKVAALA